MVNYTEEEVLDAILLSKHVLLKEIYSETSGNEVYELGMVEGIRQLSNFLYTSFASIPSVVEEDEEELEEEPTYRGTIN